MKNNNSNLMELCSNSNKKKTQVYNIIIRNNRKKLKLHHYCKVMMNCHKKSSRYKITIEIVSNGSNNMIIHVKYKAMKEDIIVHNSKTYMKI